MTKKKSLTKVQHAKMERMLQERQARLFGGGRVRKPVDDSERGGDEADIASMAQDSEMELDTRVRESRELQLIEQALVRISDGSYGNCEECHEAIAVARLEALPFAQYCIDCQEKMDEQGVPTDRYEVPNLD